MPSDDDSNNGQNTPPRRSVELFVFNGARYLTLLSVIGSLAGAFLMFLLGVIRIIDAYRVLIPAFDSQQTYVGTDAAAIINVIEALDRFLIAIVLLYFAYGVYELFIRRRSDTPTVTLTSRLRVESIGQLKQVVAEVILVVLFVLFLRVALQVYGDPDAAMTWARIATVGLLPLSIVLLAAALRLVELHPKPLRNTDTGKTSLSDQPVEPGERKNNPPS